MLSRKAKGVAYAFFDFDGTLINIKSMFSFLEFYCDHVVKDSHAYRRITETMASMEGQGASRETLNKYYYRQYAGVKWPLLLESGNSWYSFESRRNPALYNIPVISKLRELQGRGVVPVLVTGSMQPCIAGFCQQFAIQHVLCTELERNSDRLTGEIVQPAIGAAKIDRILQFLASRQFDVDIDECFAFGDHISDAGMLSMVGNAYVVSGDRSLEAIAQQKGWSLI